MKKDSKKNKIDAIESSGVPSETPVGLSGQKLAGEPHTAGGTPPWKGVPLKPGEIGVPPKKLT